MTGGRSLIETGDAVAQEVRRRLEQEDLLSQNHGPGIEQFWTSGPPDGVRKTLCRLWDRGVRVMRLPEAYAGEV